MEKSVEYEDFKAVCPRDGDFAHLLLVAKALGAKDFCRRVWNNGSLPHFKSDGALCCLDWCISLGEKVAFYYYCGNVEVVECILCWMACAKRLGLCYDVARHVAHFADTRNSMKNARELRKDGLFRSLLPNDETDWTFRCYVNVYDAVYKLLNSTSESEKKGKSVYMFDLGKRALVKD